MYEIYYERHVLKDLERIPDKDLNKIIQVFDKLRSNPKRHGTKKLKGKKGFYRMRQGKFRIIFTVNDQDKIIHVYLVQHRKNIYRKF